jgi:2-oxo-4-hydroxy-4-carboxy-5-ureidoimidazoline decarboxylase
MERMPQVTLTELNELDRDGFTAALNNVFEYSPWIADRVAADRPFAGVRQLFDAMASVVVRTRPTTVMTSFETLAGTK